MDTPVIAQNLAPSGSNMVLDDIRLEFIIDELRTSKKVLLSLLTKICKEYKINENDKNEAYKTFNDNFEDLIKDATKYYNNNKHIFIEDINYNIYHQIAHAIFKRNGNTLILCDKQYGMEFIRVELLNKTAFALLNSPEYLQLHQSQLEVSMFLHNRVLNFH
eukprot:501511_1